MGCHFLLQCMKVKSEGEVAQSCLAPDYTFPYIQLPHICPTPTLQLPLLFAFFSTYLWLIFLQNALWADLGQWATFVFSLRHQPWLWPGPDRTRGAVNQGLASTLPWRSLSPPSQYSYTSNVPFLGFLPHFAGTPALVASWDQAAWEVHRLKAYRFETPLVCRSEIKSLAGNRSCDWKAFLPLFWIYHFFVCWFSVLLVMRNLIPFSLLIFAVSLFLDFIGSSLYSGCSDDSRLSTSG